MDGQSEILSYLEAINKDPISNTTCVVQNGVCKNITWKELFDSTKYDTLVCVTYVSSASFFAKAVGQFKSVKLVVGIEKSDVKKAIAESVTSRVMQAGNKFFEELSDGDKQRLIDEELVVRFSKTEFIIHSKFYLLSNAGTGENRLIFGSANLTNTAFDNSIKQYEDVMVFDNSPMFEIYKKRFDCIYEVTEDYVPSDTIEKYKEGKLISMADYTSEEKTENIIEIMKRENIVPVCNETVLKYVQEAQAENEKEVTETKATFEVITSVSKKKKGDKTGQLVLKTGQELENVTGKIVDILFRHTKSEADIQRFSLTFNDTDKKQYIIYPKTNDKNVRAPEIFDRFATKEEITEAIVNINDFMKSYEIYVSQNDSEKEQLSRIFEILLYAFSSSYIFKLRQQTIGSKADIPIMLVIGGRAHSGKSHLLAYIDRILSGRQLIDDKRYIQYKDIERKSVLGDLFLTDNTYPLLIDEVSSNFFNSTASNKGEALIKYLSNSLDAKHPVMICTTNTASFSIPYQVARRVYFIKVDSCFDEKNKAMADQHYARIMEKANNLLFRDFCARMGEKISNNDNLFVEGRYDYLSVAREIFTEYYRLAEMEIPSYFPNELYNDFEMRGKKMWLTLYNQAKDQFKYTKKKKGTEATLTINLKDLSSGNKDVQVYLNYLKQDVLLEEAGLYVVLKANAFCDWIGVKRIPRWRRK